MKKYLIKQLQDKKTIFVFFCFFTIIITNIVKAQEQVDVGIFESTPDTLVIKARPNYNIPDLALTNVQFTIKWSETSQVTSTEAPFSYINFVFGISAQGPAVIYNGYRYQIYAAVNGNLIDWTAGEEYPICEIVYNYSGGDCTEFEIASDSWTAANNGEYYFEVLGDNKTGIKYQPAVNLGSEGGSVTGSTTICLGDNTGNLSLVNYCCTVNKWQKRLNSGSWTDIPSTSGLTQYSEIPSSAGIWEYRAEVQRYSCPVDYSLPAVIIVESATTWTGSSDSNWDNPGNWTCGVPDATINAIIPDVSKAPFPIISSAANCNALTIQTGAGLVIAYNGSLTLSGNFINDGSFTIESLATGTGSFIDNDNISGTAKVQRYLTDNSGVGTFYHHQVCAPVNNQTLADFNLIPGSTYAYEYNPATGQWVNLYLLTTSIPPMKGIMLSTVNNTTAHTVNFIDALVTGNTSIAVTGNPNPNPYHNLVGNPYPSPIHWDEINPHANINNVVYIWDPSASNYKNYVEVTGGDNSCKYIQVGQAFFIECTSSTSFQVTNAARVHNNAPYLKDGYVDYLKLMTAGGTNSSADETYVHFMDDVTTGYDVNYDAKKWHSMHNDFVNDIIEATEIYTIASDDNLLSINAMPPLGNENVSIPLHFVPGSNGEYNITASYIETFANGTEIYLEDLLTGDDWHALHIYPEYTFNATQDDQYNMFILHFFGPTGIDELNSNAIKIYSDRNYAYIINKGNERIKEIKVYNTLGDLIIYKITPDNSFNKLYVNDVIAYYIVKVITDKHVYTEKVFITR
ncbi:MAG: hypothetical protein K8R46_00645 [Pirellulales bacterium]|nr:hypothetical protein [Pirellulales bacterium]